MAAKGAGGGESDAQLGLLPMNWCSNEPGLHPMLVQSIQAAQCMYFCGAC